MPLVHQEVHLSQTNRSEYQYNTVFQDSGLKTAEGSRKLRIRRQKTRSISCRSTFDYDTAMTQGTFGVFSGAFP